MPDPTDFFHEMSAASLTRPDVATGTMMGFPCLRVAGAFFASCDHRTGDLIVKLPKDRVAQLIADGVGKPFAPRGPHRGWCSSVPGTRHVPKLAAALWRRHSAVPSTSSGTEPAEWIHPGAVGPPASRGTPCRPRLTAAGSEEFPQRPAMSLRTT